MSEETGFMEGQGYDKWCADLGVGNGPLTRAGINTSLRYFHARMPKLPRKTMLSFLRGMDLHKPVKRIMLDQGTTVAAFRQPTEDPLKLFYTKVGSSVHRLGVNPAQRQFHRYLVTSPVEVLASRAAGMSWGWTLPGPDYLANGGDVQYIIPHAYLYLAVLCNQAINNPV